MIIAVDEQASHDKVDFDDGKLIPGARGWIAKMISKPSYDAAESLLYFLDKYTTIVVGGARAMGKYYKQNRGKTLLDKLTVSDIAYSILVYENAYDVWSEEIIKTKTCSTEDERKEFRSTAMNKYHVKRGTRLPVYQDGWTNDGQNYFKDLCTEIQAMKKNEDLWATLKVHWSTYGKKYHKYSYVDTENGQEEVMSNKKQDVDNDDDCIVSLPGELGDNDIELDLEDNNSEYQSFNDVEATAEEEDIEEERMVVERCGRRKRQRMWPV